MKFFYLLFLIFISVLNAQNSNFGPIVNEQIKYVNLINDDNATQESIMELTKKQEEFYSIMLENIMINKTKYIRTRVSHASEIYALEKIIKLNKRRGNKYAVLRDEITIKSYKILDMQASMLKDILRALDEYSYDELQVKMSEIFTQNQIKISALDIQNYDDILKIADNSKVIKQVQISIKDYKALLEINTDVIKYLAIFDKKLYRLNKYSQYKLIKPILYMNKLPIVKEVNTFLEEFGFNIIKLILIFITIVLIYFVRTILYTLIENYIVTIKSLEKYSKDLLGSVRRLVETLIIFINIEMVFYVYNDFVSIKELSSMFNMLYGFIFTFIIYRVANSIAKIKLNKISVDENSVKLEVLNVGIKIVNFIIWIIGALIILFLAGVDLTAVLSGLGIGGFAIALAAKDSLANFFGTLSILFSDVYSQGDWVKIGDVEGTVVEIGLRVTILRTFDNAMISIPNGTVANKDVKNWNRRSLGRRIKMRIGVKYDSKSSDIKQAIEDIYSMLDKHKGIATVNTKHTHKSIDKLRIVRSKDDAEGVKRTLLVFLDEFGGSSINILIYCFAKTVIWREWHEVKQDVMFQMMEILEKNNLEFAFPSMSLYHENNLEILEKK